MSEHTDEAGAPDRPDAKLLELLVCPATKGPLEYHAAAGELISFKARLAYPIRNGVPLMTAEAARPLDDDDDRRPPPRPAG